jgi:hypothetical protein
VDAVFCQSGLRRVGPGTVPHAASRVRVPVIPRPGRRRDSWEHRAPRGSACRPHPLAPSPSLERGNQWRAPLTQGSALGSHLAPFQGLSAPGSPAGRLWRAGGWRARSAAGPSLKVTGRVTACSFLSDTTPAAASGARDDTTAAPSPAVPFLPTSSLPSSLPVCFPPPPGIATMGGCSACPRTVVPGSTVRRSGVWQRCRM